MRIAQLPASARIALFVRVGLYVASAFSLYVVAFTLLAGHRVLAPFGISLPLLIASYYVTLALAGLVVGAILPLGRTYLGAAVVGAVAGIFLWPVNALFGESPGWDARAWALYLLFSACLGSVGGLIARSRHG